MHCDITVMSTICISNIAQKLHNKGNYESLGKRFIRSFRMFCEVEVKKVMVKGIWIKINGKE